LARQANPHLHPELQVLNLGFQTLEPGSSTIYLEYSRPWEGGEKGEWTFTLDVVVKQ